jgi:diaminohydroxyphosphoribosylaminopyrimidine deaminase/5-amino-6-(5-phosphoribosylamino)uracil reductase
VRARVGPEEDRRWMRLALRLAARARGRTAPNPMVGALVVRGGRALARGWHRAAGQPHAEALALERAGRAARGATLYVTLEPCAHWGRTPPCVDAVLAAHPARVVVGMRDPDPRTAGRSLRRLRAAGIEVAVGIEEAACRALNEGFLSRVVRGRPFTQLKLATSLDGRIATRSGDSRWITGVAARECGHALRRAVDAVAVGSGTLLADDPELTARRAGRVVARPLRIVIDSALRARPDARVIDPSDPGRAWILTARGHSARRRARLEHAGARVIELPGQRGHLDLRAAWRALGRAGVNDVLVEGGGGLAAALLRARLVDRIHVFSAPLLIGGDGRPALGELGAERLDQAIRLARVRTRRIGQDGWLTADVEAR